jgi:hypothetical protein
MKNILGHFFLMFSVMGFSSCGREKLSIKHHPITVNALKNERPIFFSYKINDTQIDEYAKNAGKFPLFGRLFQAIAVVLANTSILSQGGHDLKLDAIDLDLTDVSTIDFNLIQYINFDKLLMSVEQATNRDSLNFIDRLEIYIKLESPIEGLAVNEKGLSKIVSFDSAEDQIGCEGHCIKFNVAKIDWKQLLATNSKVHLVPKLIINSVPLSTMKLAIGIDFSVKFNLGF